jgi:type IV pilus assembly protein PilM
LIGPKNLIFQVKQQPFQADKKKQSSDCNVYVFRDDGSTSMKWIEEQQDKFKKIVDLDWKQMLKASQLQVFGLDIGSSSIKAVQLHKNGDGYVVTAAGITDVDDGIEGNDGRREVNILNAIHRCLQSAGIQTKLTVCGIGGPEIAVRHFSFPSLPPEEIEGAVLLEAKQVCPFNTNDGVVDYQLIPNDSKNTNGILVAVTNKLLKEKTRFVEDAVLHSVLVDVDGLALLNCFRGCQKYEAGQTIAILNVGSSYATLAIVSDDDLPFVRDLTYPGKAIIEHTASKGNVSAGTVERVPTGHENPDKIQLELGDSLEAACRKLTIDVAETLRYYAVQKKSEMVEKVFICGGLVLVKEFLDLLNSQLPAAGVLWNPFDKISYDASLPCADILRKKGPAMAVAAGLAMRTI